MGLQTGGPTVVTMSWSRVVSTFFAYIVTFSSLIDIYKTHTQTFTQNQSIAVPINLNTQYCLFNSLKVIKVSDISPILISVQY